MVEHAFPPLRFSRLGEDSTDSFFLDPPILGLPHFGIGGAASKQTYPVARAGSPNSTLTVLDALLACMPANGQKHSSCDR
ncbi:MAG: hypothetical protein DIU63_14540 [Proteobacteria bacterium]|jgi:hypothetical protein|nr:MAG: hypothetical protein DIU63_14540 [Pseudomonadota bacterium]